MRRALADRLLELGTFGELARELGVSETSARRLVRKGPPASWKDARLLTFAEQLYGMAHRAERARDATAREALERRRRAPVYAPAARVAVMGSLRRALADLERRRPCEPGTWSPRASLAGELGISSARLGRWLAVGMVPQEFMERAVSWAQARAEAEVRRIGEQGHVERLLEMAKKPAYAHTLPGAPRRFAHRAPDLQTHEGRTESEEQSGYQWVLRVEQWSTFELIDRWVMWAATRERPVGMRGLGRWWIVTALCSIYHPRGRKAGKLKSPGARRQFNRAGDKAIGSDLSINVPVSSRSVRSGGLERAVRLFAVNLLAEHCEQDQIFVHGLIVRNWRDRTDRERKNYRQRVSARLFNEAALAKLARDKRRAEKRAAAKKQALERRGSAGVTRPGSSTRGSRSGAPAGARSRKKKRR